MQLPTHVTFGVIIQILIGMLIQQRDMFFYFIVFLCALLSHFILDSLAIMTYHPPNRQHTNFWLYWHIFVYISGFFLIIGSLYINSLFIIGILGANLPDLWDWVFLRAMIKSQNNKLYVHKYANKIRSLFKEQVPDLTFNKIGILPELILIIFVSFILIITLV